MADKKSMHARVVGIRYIVHPYSFSSNDISVKSSRDVPYYPYYPCMYTFFNLPSLLHLLILFNFFLYLLLYFFFFFAPLGRSVDGH